MWEVDIPTGKMMVSENWSQIFGYHSDEIITIHDWVDKVHPEDIATAKLAYENYLSGKTSIYIAEIRYVCEDGHYKWIRSKGVIIARDTEGKPTRVIGTHTALDIEPIHIISEDQYREIVDYSEAIICTHDLSGAIITINPAVQKILGYTPDELIGKSISSVVVEEHRSAFDDKYIQSIINRGTAEGVMKVADNKGALKYLLYHNHLFNNDGSDSYVIGFAQDITSRVQTEEALRTSIDTFHSAFTYSAIGMALVSPTGQWLEVNNAVCHITGYTKEELLKLSFQDITHPDDLEKDLSLVNQMLAKTIESYNLEKRYITKAGTIVWVLLTVSLVWNADNTPKFFISQIKDITQTKQLSDELNRRNAELETIKDSLINKVNQLEEFSYIIAHNVRGPVKSIQMLGEVLQADAGENAAFSKADAANLIVDTTASLLESLETLISIAQVRMHKAIESENCDIADTVELVCGQLQGIIHEKQANVWRQIETDYILFPKAYLENILYNLISNALKYSRLNIPPQITVSCKMVDNKTVLSVKDNGLGIDLEKYADRVFKLNEYFHQGYDSKGIGLYLVKTQVESMGGTITLESTVNEGTEFIITI